MSRLSNYHIQELEALRDPRFDLPEAYRGSNTNVDWDVWKFKDRRVGGKRTRRYTQHCLRLSVVKAADYTDSVRLADQLRELSSITWTECWYVDYQLTQVLHPFWFWLKDYMWDGPIKIVANYCGPICPITPKFAGIVSSSAVAKESHKVAVAIARSQRTPLREWERANALRFKTKYKIGFAQEREQRRLDWRWKTSSFWRDDSAAYFSVNGHWPPHENKERRQRPITYTVHCSRPACHETQHLLVCGGCDKVFYCSPACQKLHWEYHKRACNRWDKPKKKDEIEKKLLS